MPLYIKLINARQINVKIKELRNSKPLEPRHLYESLVKASSTQDWK